MILNRIYHFCKGPNPLHPAVWEGRLRPLSFRRFVAADTPACLELYDLNETARFPEGSRKQYEKVLAEKSLYVLVTERAGEIIATGGIQYSGRQDIAALCFGLVRPSHQGTGIGTALALARLALLNPNRTHYNVFIFAVAKSVAFYRRFGFKPFQAWKDLHGDEHPSGHLVITRSEILKCRALLQKHGVVVPQDEDQVPFRQRADLEAIAHPRSQV